MKTLIRKAESIYQYVKADGSPGSFLQRVRVNGKPTWKKLAASTLKEAKARVAANKAQYEQWRAFVPGVRNPYVVASDGSLLGQIVKHYAKSGYPASNQSQTRSPKTVSMIANSLTTLLKWPGWDKQPLENINPRVLTEYANWRREHNQRLLNGRTIDVELTVLNGALRWGLWNGFINVNPLPGLQRPKFQQGKSVNCRDCRPESPEELHKLAKIFFTQGVSWQVLGWQLLFEAFTGCRTSEALLCRWDAKPGQPGFIDGDVLHVKRLKHGVSPWVAIHEDLKVLLGHMQNWREVTFPNSPWFFPSCKDSSKHVDVSFLVHKLGDVVAEAKEYGLVLPKGARRTSHGLRSYYVTCRRSQGIDDRQIAAEIGDKTGEAIIVSTYGALAPNWLKTDAGKLTFVPKGKPAWHVFENL